jgi:hypothetical protein
MIRIHLMRVIILSAMIATSQSTFAQVPGDTNNDGVRSPAEYVTWRNALEGVDGSASLSGIISGGVPALPTFSVDLLRDGGGDPFLSMSGNWLWEVLVVPADFTSSLAVEVGFKLNELTGIETGPLNFWDTSNPGAPVTGLQSAFDYTGNDDDGFQLNLANDEVYVSVGSEILPAGSDPIVLLLIEGGSAQNDSVLEVLGAWSSATTAGDQAIVAQEISAGNIASNVFSGTFEVAGIPEPSTALLLILAAPLAVATRRRVA